MSKPTPVIDNPGRLALFAILFLGFTGAGLWAVARFLDTGSVQFDSRLLQPQVIIALAALLVVFYLVDALRLRFALRGMGSDIGMAPAIRLVFINFFFSNITPLATGGGIAQVVFMRQHGVPVGIATAATTARTLLAALITFSGALFFLFSEPRLEESAVFSRLGDYLGIFVALYLVGFVALIARPHWLFQPIAWLLGLAGKLHLLREQRRLRWLTHLRRELAHFSRGFRAFLRGNRRDVALAIVFAALFLLCLFSFSVILLWGLGYDIGYLTIVGLQMVVTLVMYFSPTPGASGVAEGLYGELFSGLITANHVLLVTLAWRFLTVYLGMLIGLVMINTSLVKRRQAHAQIQ